MGKRLPLLLVSLSLVLAPSRALRSQEAKVPRVDAEAFEKQCLQPGIEKVKKNPVWDAASGVLKRMGVDQCGAIRYNYKCQGGFYGAYVRRERFKLESIYARNGERPTAKNVFFIGNSHTRELAEAYLCQRHKLVDSWRVLDPDGCLQDVPYSMPVGKTAEHSYHDDLSHATLRGGGSVYLAISHPWTFMGRKGLAEIFGLLGMDVRQLDAVVLGEWNPESWAHERMPILSPICASYRLQWASERTPWATKDFANFLQDVGFSGELLLGGTFAGSRVRLGGDLSGYNFSVRSLWSGVPRHLPDGADVGDGHACLPGLPDLVVADL